MRELSVVFHARERGRGSAPHLTDLSRWTQRPNWLSRDRWAGTTLCGLFEISNGDPKKYPCGFPLSAVDCKTCRRVAAKEA